MCKAQVACYELSSIDFVDAHLFPLQGGSCRCPHKSTVIQPDLFVNVLFKAFWLSVHCWGSACFQWEINSFLLYHGWVLHRELIPWTPLEMLQWCQPHILDRNVLTTITNVAWNTVINKIPSRYFTPIMSHCERTKLMICHRKAFKCHKWLGVWCLRCCPWPDMASDHWRMNWTFEKKKAGSGSDGAKCSEPTLEKSDIIQRSDLTRWSYAMQVTRWHLLIGWSEVYSRGCTSTSPIFLPRHPSHILESEAASKDKHDKPREREREAWDSLFCSGSKEWKCLMFTYHLFCSSFW